MNHSQQNLANYIGKWMKYPWMSGYDPEILIHPDELIKHQGKINIGLAHCIAIEDDHLIIKTRENVLKVKYWDKIIILPDPNFSWNDEVCEVQRPEIRGIIDYIEWHRKEGEYKYYLIVNGKRKSRRYNQGELQKITQ